MRISLKTMVCKIYAIVRYTPVFRSIANSALYIYKEGMNGQSQDIVNHPISIYQGKTLELG